MYDHFISLIFLGIYSTPSKDLKNSVSDLIAYHILFTPLLASANHSKTNKHKLSSSYLGGKILLSIIYGLGEKMFSSN